MSWLEGQLASPQGRPCQVLVPVHGTPLACPQREGGPHCSSWTGSQLGLSWPSALGEGPWPPLLQPPVCRREGAGAGQGRNTTGTPGTPSPGVPGNRVEVVPSSCEVTEPPQQPAGSQPETGR